MGNRPPFEPVFPKIVHKPLIHLVWAGTLYSHDAEFLPLLVYTLPYNRQNFINREITRDTVVQRNYIRLVTKQALRGLKGPDGFPTCTNLPNRPCEPLVFGFHHGRYLDARSWHGIEFLFFFRRQADIILTRVDAMPEGYATPEF